MTWAVRFEGLGWIGRDVALAAFFAGITPTATAAPVIMSFLRGRVDYVIVAFLLTNVSVSALLPAVLPSMLGQPVSGALMQVAGSVGMLVFAPLGLAWLFAGCIGRRRSGLGVWATCPSACGLSR